MKKKLVAIFLLIVMIFTCAGGPLVYAATPARELEAADALYSYGLFRGTGSGYELERVPMRYEALVMLIRLLGKETEALTGIWAHPFKDVAAWADKYVGYAYEKDLTKGTGPNTFDGDQEVTCGQYLTFLLRALGFRDDLEDFEYTDPFWLTDWLNITEGDYDADSGFTRGDVAYISYKALDVRRKNSEKTLFQNLMSMDAIPEDATYPSVTEGLPYITTKQDYYEAEPGETIDISVFFSCTASYYTLHSVKGEAEVLSQEFSTYNDLNIKVRAKNSGTASIIFHYVEYDGVSNPNSAAIAIINIVIK